MNTIRNIHLIHHSHTDFGYTDLPSTAWDMHVDYIRRALACARKTASYPKAAQFRWVCESALVVEKFLAQASRSEKRHFDTLVKSRHLEVTAMPHNTTSLMDAAEWDAIHQRLLPLYDAYKPVTVFQNDINGLPWGGIPAWKKAGIRYIWMGVNLHAGGHPEPAPCFWNWEGPTGDALLTYLSLHYNAASSFTHRSEWRRGPVPHSWDVWYNEPQPGDIYGTSPAELKEAHAILLESLHKNLPASYALPIFGIQATNQYRFDNDPPLPQLSEFVRAWNAAGLQPAMQLSTCSEFMGEVQRMASRKLPTRRGDWCDWWAHGVASTPVETALNQQTKRALSDTPRAAKLLRSRSEPSEALQKSWFSASMFDEHTFASYDSVAYPYRVSTQGGLMQCLDLAYRADEDTRLARADIIRKSPVYRPFSTTRFLTVLNPGDTTRSGWVEISAKAIRYPANAVRDTASGELLPLEDIEEAEWSNPTEKSDIPFEVPNDEWAFSVCIKRFYVRDLAKGKSRRFELVQADLSRPVNTAVRGGRNDTFAWAWNKETGLLTSLKLGRRELIDSRADYGLGQIVVEFADTFGARAKLMQHDTSKNGGVAQHRTPLLRAFAAVDNPVSDRYVSEWDDPSFHRIRQQWDFHREGGLIELTTTLWMKEETAAQSFFAAFPFALRDAQPRYYSWGHATRVGADQLPGACGEYAMVQEGVEFVSPGCTLSLATPDAPLGTFEKLHAFNGQRIFTPRNAHFYSVIHNNYWSTNFYITRAGKATIRHRLSPHAPLAALRDELWAFPSK